jgi:hypothetical protein
MVWKLIHLVLVALPLGALPGPACAQPVTLEPVVLSTPAGEARGLVARVRLDDPRVEVLVTGPLSPGQAGCPEGAEAVAIATDAWRASEGAALAINANFFGRAERWPCLDVIGLSVSEGRVVSPPRRHGERFDPALIVGEDGVARVGYFGEEALPGAEAAVAGVGGSATASVPGTLLIEGGVNTGATARVAPDRRHPRTAAGVADGGRTLVLAVIDGRREGWSVGVTLPELAELLLERGVTDALNLDGGGSSAMVCAAGGVVVSNRPAEGKHRPVANHLGVRERSVPSEEGSGVGAEAPPFVVFFGGLEALSGFRIVEEIKR